MKKRRVLVFAAAAAVITIGVATAVSGCRFAAKEAEGEIYPLKP